MYHLDSQQKGTYKCGYCGENHRYGSKKALYHQKLERRSKISRFEKQKKDVRIIYNEDEGYVDYKIPRWAEQNWLTWRAFQSSGEAYFDTTEELGNEYIRLYGKDNLKERVQNFAKEINSVKTSWSKVDYEIMLEQGENFDEMWKKL